jgi:hypothetical protein
MSKTTRTPTQVLDPFSGILETVQQAPTEAPQTATENSSPASSSVASQGSNLNGSTFAPTSGTPEFASLRPELQPQANPLTQAGSNKNESTPDEPSSGGALATLSEILFGSSTSEPSTSPDPFQMGDPFSGVTGDDLGPSPELEGSTVLSAAELACDAASTFGPDSIKGAAQTGSNFLSGAGALVTGIETFQNSPCETDGGRALHGTIMGGASLLPGYTVASMADTVLNNGQLQASLSDTVAEGVHSLEGGTPDPEVMEQHLFSN